MFSFLKAASPKKWFLYTLTFIAGVFVVEQMLIYNQYGVFASDVEVLYYFIISNKDKVLWLLLGGYIVFMVYIYFMQKSRDQRADCTVKTIKLEKLARQYWLGEKRIEALEKIKSEKESVVEKIRHEKVYIMLNNKATSDFFKLNIEPIMENSLSKKEIDEIVKVLNILAGHAADCPSVVKNSENDSEYIKRGKHAKIEAFGLTEFEILERVNLLDHTLRVATIALDEAKADKRVIKSQYFLIIMGALLHDIGKLVTFAKKNNVLKEDLELQSHEAISGRIVNETYSDLSQYEMLKKIVAKHHSPDPDSMTILEKIVRNADLAAREKEKTNELKILTRERDGSGEKNILASKENTDVKAPNDPPSEAKEPKETNDKDAVAPSDPVAEAKAKFKESSVLKKIEDSEPAFNKGIPLEEKKREVLMVDFSIHLSEFRNALLSKLYKEGRRDYRRGPNWALLDDLVLVRYTVVQQTIIDIFGVSKEDSNEYEAYREGFYAYLISLGILKEIGGAKFITSNRFLMQDSQGEQRNYSCVPFSCEFFETEPHDLQGSYRKYNSMFLDFKPLRKK